jgi:tetratricopeptide (TPR) repeat protein
MAGRGLELLAGLLADGLLLPDDRLELAGKLLANGRADQAEAILEGLKDHSELATEAELGLLAIYACKQDDDSLARLFARLRRRLARRHGSMARACAELSLAATDAGLPSHAQSYAAQAIRLFAAAGEGVGNPTVKRMWREYLRGALAQGDPAAAVVPLRRAMDEFKAAGDSGADALRAFLGPQETADFAIALAGHCREGEARFPRVHLALARRLAGDGFTDEAAEQYRLAVAARPMDLGPRLEYVELLRRQGEASAAMREVRDLVVSAPQAPAVYRMYGDLLAGTGDLGEAERAFTTIVEFDPLGATAHRELADIRERQERWQEAAVHWRIVCDSSADNPEPLLGLAAAQAKAGRVEQAEATLKTVLEQDWGGGFSDVQARARQLLDARPATADD